MSSPDVRVSPGWLALREPADAAARAADLVEVLALPEAGHWVIHDLGGGTGSMGRWLAPRLPGRQHWVVHDRDADLLEIVGDVPFGPAADGAAVTVEPRRSELTRLGVDDLAAATLITASALLDMLTGEELTGLVGVSAAVGCPVLLTLSVVGRVSLVPADPLDHRVADAFNDHQRRATERGRLLGPDAVAFAVSEADLIAEWFTGWVDAACDQVAELAAETAAYTRRRLEQARNGRLTVTVAHADLLALPRRGA